MESKLVWLDCDPGHDDAFAIILAGHNSKLRLIGISTVCGNQTVEKTTINALRILSVSGLEDVDVVKGSSGPLCRKSRTSCEEIHGDSGLDGTDFPPLKKEPVNKNCITHMYDCISSQPRKVTIIATAQLTNVALLLKVFPEVKEHIEQIVLMGGSIGLGNMTAAAEWNIMCDPEAAQIVFESGVKTAMIPLEVTHTALCTKEVLDKIEALSSRYSKLVHELLTFFQGSYLSLFAMPDPPLHDPCAVAYVISPEIFEGLLVRVDVEMGSRMCDGRTICDMFGMTKNVKNVFVATRMNVTAFWDIMLDAIMSADKVSELNVTKV
jgi:inosine-uridine nucleoside N-ribohydrolase